MPYIIQYDPYNQAASFKYKSEEKGLISGLMHLKKEQEDALDMLKHDIILQNQIENLINVLKQINGNQDVDLEFVGTTKDYGDLQSGIKQISPYCTAKKDDDSFYYEPEYVRRKIKDSCAAVCREIDDLNKKYPEYSSSLRFSSDEIDETLNGRTPVVLIGSGSTGKSSVINSLIGAEVFPAADGTTTEAMCEILPANFFEVCCKNEGTELSVDPAQKTQAEQLLSKHFGYMGHFKTDDPYDCMYQTIAVINETIKTGERDITDLRIKVPFKNIQNIADQVVFYDTPGPDSKTCKNHKAVLNNTLSRFKKGIAIFVTNPTDIEKTNLRGFLQQNVEDYENVSDILNINAGIILVNAADSSNIRKIKEGKESRNFHLNGIKNEFERQMFLREQDRIIYYSSVFALGVHKSESDYWWDSKFEEIIYDGTKKVDNPSEKFYLPLATEAELPVLRRKAVIDAYRIAEQNYCNNPSEENRRELIAHNSGLRALEYELGFVVNELSICNLCAQAQRRLKDMLKSVEKNIADISVRIETSENARQKKYDEKYADIISLLFESEDSILNKAIKTAKNSSDSAIGDEATSIASVIEKASKDIRDRWKTIKSKPEDNIERIILSVINTLKVERNEKAENWYKERFEQFKEECIKIVFESESLSCSEKKELEDCLKDWKPIEFNKTLACIDEQMLKKSVLFIIKVLDKEKCVNAAENRILKILGDQKSRILGELEEQLISSCKAAKDRFFTETKIKTANPELKQLQNQIDSLTRQNREYQNVQKIISTQLSDIGTLTELQTKG